MVEGHEMSACKTTKFFRDLRQSQSWCTDLRFGLGLTHAISMYVNVFYQELIIFY